MSVSSKPSFVTFDRVSASTPEGRVLFENLTLAVAAERVGLVGRNGSGKSTLLRLVAGQGEPSSGAISVSGRVGELAQRWPDDTISLAEALGVTAGLARLARLEAGHGSEEDMAEADWTLEHRIAGDASPYFCLFGAFATAAWPIACCARIISSMVLMYRAEAS